MRKYWEVLKSYKLYMLISPVLVLVSVFSETLQPLLMAKVIDDGVLLKDISTVLRLGGIMVLVSLVGLVMTMINVVVSSKISMGFGTDLRSALFSKIQRLSFSDVDKFSTASLITRLTDDITKIQMILLMSLRMLLRSPMLFFMAFFFIIHINADLAIVVAFAIPILAVSIYFILKRGFPFFVKVQQKLDNLNAFVRENLINIRVVKSFVREDFETGRFENRNEDLRDTVIRASNTMITLFPAMQLILNLSVMAVLWVGGNRVIGGGMEIGELISCVNYLTQILMSIMMLSMVIMMAARAAASSERVLEVMNTEPSLENTAIGMENKYEVKHGVVVFKDVAFRYTGSENDVLKNINFSIKPGETVAIVGATGAAKSTMVQLIPRLFDVTSGEIIVDGVNVKDYNLEQLHWGVGMVLQKNELFSGTILENLKWGKPAASEEDVVEAARIAQADTFIQSFPDGYQTVLGRGGVNLSGGQKQRLCIARALLRKPKILILDDSTSAVDTDTEQQIRLGLDTTLADTTVLVVTQRVRTMQTADRVIVLDNGQIEDIGTPEELLDRSEIYKEIYNSQQITI